MRFGEAEVGGSFKVIIWGGNASHGGGGRGGGGGYTLGGKFSLYNTAAVSNTVKYCKIFYRISLFPI